MAELRLKVGPPEDRISGYIFFFIRTGNVKTIRKLMTFLKIRIMYNLYDEAIGLFNIHLRGEAMGQNNMHMSETL